MLVFQLTIQRAEDWRPTVWISTRKSPSSGYEGFKRSELPDPAGRWVVVVAIMLHVTAGGAAWL